MHDRERMEVAVVGTGPVGTGQNAEGIPALAACLEELSKDFSITVYSILKPDTSTVHPRLRLRFLPFRTPLLALDQLLLSAMILWDALRHRVDLFHAIGAFPAGHVCTRLAKLLRIPCLVSLHAEELARLPDCNFGDLRSRKRHRITARVCRSADVLTVLTRFQANGLADLGIPPTRAEALPFGIALERFPFARKALSPPYVFLHVAYSHPVKDVETLLETFRRVSDECDCRLKIIGHGHRNGRTAALIEKHALSNIVEIIEPVSNTTLHEHYARAHFLLHTSRYESQGVVFNEAMASGVVVCATRAGLAADLGDEYCVTAPLRDAAGLARAILGVIREPERYAQLCTQAYAWSAAHDLRWMVEQHKNLYQRLLGRLQGRLQNESRASSPE
jgi:glycosyltransferase involved in cell wall biosynthesis